MVSSYWVAANKEATDMNLTKNLIEPKLYMNLTKNLIEPKLSMNPTKNLIELKLYRGTLISLQIIYKLLEL